MASARAHASTSEPRRQHQREQKRPGSCGATSGGHASLVSFARSASARNLPDTQPHHNPAPQFGLPSKMGAPRDNNNNNTLTTSQAAAPSADARPTTATQEFARASAAMRAMAVPSKRNPDANDAEVSVAVGSTRSPRVGSVPKRMREPMTVDKLTGMLHELPCPSAGTCGDDTSSSEKNVGQGNNAIFGGDYSPASDAQQKRRRTITNPCSGSDNNNINNTDPPPTTTTAEYPTTTEDDMTDDLCFLVDQVALKEDVEKEQKFMPYIF